LIKFALEKKLLRTLHILTSTLSSVKVDRRLEFPGVMRAFDFFLSLLHMPFWRKI